MIKNKQGTAKLQWKLGIRTIQLKNEKRAVGRSNPKDTKKEFSFEAKTRNQNNVQKTKDLVENSKR